MEQMEINIDEHQEPPGVVNVADVEAFMNQIGGNYSLASDSNDAEIEKQTAKLKSKLSSLNEAMGKGSFSRNPEPLRATEPLHWDLLLKEMKSFQDLLIDEHKEKRRKFKLIANNAQKTFNILMQKKQKQSEEEGRYLKTVAKSLSNNAESFWKKIEMLVIERKKRELQATLNEKKRMRLDKFIESAKKHSMVLSEGYIQEKKAPVDIIQPRQVQTVKEESPELAVGLTYLPDDGEFAAAAEEDMKLDEEMESGSDEGNDELNALENDANVPIEELLKRVYGYESRQAFADVESEVEGGFDDEDDEDGMNEDGGDSSQMEAPMDNKIVELASVEFSKREGSKRRSTVKVEAGEPNQDEDNFEIGESSEKRIDKDMQDEQYWNEAHDSTSAVKRRSTVKMNGIHSNAVKRMKLIDEEVDRKHQPSPQPFKPKEVTVSQLIHGKLREYQHEGLNWFVNLNDKNINGILADEMGLGKTLQTIAVLAHMATHNGNWGPHLIVVPTSVLFNWEMEFKKFCPGFKVLTYYGSPQERAKKRQGWNRPYGFHVCIASYTTVIKDARIFKRRNWKYLVLDEAQNIKNFESKRWQTLLTFNTERRILLTGTPLQNNLLELWSLMHFLMPEVFASHSDFKEWFGDPLTFAIEKQQLGGQHDLVSKLHSVLRPYLLRRLKKDVEKQMPSKIEHVIRCSLARRQRVLYDEFINRRDVKDTMAQGNYRGMMNVLMQLRKVCNHPDLFEPKPILTPCWDDLLRIQYVIPSLVCLWLFEPINLKASNEFSPIFSLLHNEMYCSKRQSTWSEELDPFSKQNAKENVWITELSSTDFYALQPYDKGGRIGAACIDDLASHLHNVERETLSVYPSILKDRKFIRYLKSLDEDAMDDKALLNKEGNNNNSKSKGPLLNPYVNTNEESHKYQIIDMKANTSKWQSDKVLNALSSFQNNELVQLEMQRMRTEALQQNVVALQRMRANNEAFHYRIPLFGRDLREWIQRECLPHTSSTVGFIASKPQNALYGGSAVMESLCLSPRDRLQRDWPFLHRFISILDYKVLPVAPDIRISGVGGKWGYHRSVYQYDGFNRDVGAGVTEFHEVMSRRRCITPLASQLLDDSGKTLVLSNLLKRLHREGHRCLLFTQFTKMLDVLESVLNYLSFTYVRLDGSTKVESRQKIVTRFNENPKVFVFISSTRSGGIGLNLTGADTVIFYDTDWNPAMDRQAMDRCHRIGQTRDVHIYRLVCQHTIEENIWKKQLQKRQLDDVVVDKGQFNADWFCNAATLREILEGMAEDNEDIYKDRVLHDSEEVQTKKPLNVTGRRARQNFENTLTAVEDAEDVSAMRETTKETANERDEFDKEFKGENGGDAESKVDAILRMPSLVSYCINFIQECIPISIHEELSDMRRTIDAEDTLQQEPNNEGRSSDINSENSEASVWESEENESSENDEPME